MKKQVLFLYDVLNYDVLKKLNDIVLQVERVKVLGLNHKRDTIALTDEHIERDIFSVEYEGNVYGKTNFTHADWDALVAEEA